MKIISSIQKIVKSLWSFIKRRPILSYSLLYLIILSYMLISFKPYSDEELEKKTINLLEKEKDTRKKIKNIISLMENSSISVPHNVFYSVSLKSKSGILKDEEMSLETSNYYQTKYFGVYLRDDKNTYILYTKDGIFKKELPDKIRISNNFFANPNINNLDEILFRGLDSIGKPILISINRDGSEYGYFPKSEEGRYLNPIYINSSSNQIIFKRHKDSTHIVLYQYLFTRDNKKNHPTDSFELVLNSPFRSGRTKIIQNDNELLLRNGSQFYSLAFNEEQKNMEKSLIGNSKFDYFGFYNESNIYLQTKGDLLYKLYTLSLGEDEKIVANDSITFKLKTPEIRVEYVFSLNKFKYIQFQYNNNMYVSKISPINSKDTFLVSANQNDIVTTEQTYDMQRNESGEFINFFYEIQGDSSYYILKTIRNEKRSTISLNSKLNKYFSYIYLNASSATPTFIGVLKHKLGTIELAFSSSQPDSLSWKELEISNAAWQSNFEFETSGAELDKVVLAVSLAFAIILYILGYVLINDRLTTPDQVSDNANKVFQSFSTLNYKLQEVDKTLIKLRIRSDAMLILGIVIGLFGVGAFLVFLENDANNNYWNGEWDLVSVRKLLTPIIMFLFIETLSLFFLRQYRLIYNDYKAYYKVYLRICNYYHVIELSGIKDKEFPKMDQRLLDEITKVFLEEKFDLRSPDAKEVPIAGEEIIKKLIDKTPTKS